MLDREGVTKQAGESTPKSGDKKDPGEKEQLGDTEKPANKKSQDQQGAPSDGPKSSPNTAKLVHGDKPPASATEHRATTADPADHWGDLPEKARDVFRSQGGADLPVRYREWIDAYYRRLNK